MTSQQIEAHKLRQAEAAKEFISKRVPLQIDPIMYKIGQDNLINLDIPTNTEPRVKKETIIPQNKTPNKKETTKKRPRRMSTQNTDFIGDQGKRPH